MLICINTKNIQKKQNTVLNLINLYNMKSLSNNSLPFKLCYVKYSNCYILYIRHKYKKSFFFRRKSFLQDAICKFLEKRGKMDSHFHGNDIRSNEIAILPMVAMTEGWIPAYFILSLCTPPIIMPSFSTLISFRFSTPIILPS